MGLLKFCVSASAVALLFRQVDERAMAEILVSARVAPIGGALLLYLFGQGLSAWRWAVIAGACGFREPLRKIVTWYFIGMFFNLFGPSTLGGDVVRSLYLGAPSGRRTLALHSVVFDRVCGLTMLVAVALFAIAAFGTFGLPLPVVWLTVAIGIGLVTAWWMVPPLAMRFLSSRNRIRLLVEGDLKRFWSDGRLLAATAGISLVFHMVQIVAIILIGSAVGVAVPWPYYFVFHPLVSIFSALPLSLAGLGIREVGYVWFLSSVENVPQETAAAFALLWLFVLLASSAVGGFVFLIYGGGMPSLRRASAAVAERTT